MSARAVVFDMDNVVFPTEGLKFAAYRRAFAERLGAAIEDTPERVGLAEGPVAKLYLERLGVEAEAAAVAELVEAKRAAYYAILAEEKFEPYAGVRELLGRLRSGGWKTGLATLSDARATATLLERFAMRELFDSVLTVESVSRPKPDPEIYLLSAERLGERPADCIAIEDSPAGVEAAKRAGMRVVAVTHSAPRERLRAADEVRDGFEELAEVLYGIGAAATGAGQET